jgi:hypothetical protein
VPALLAYDACMKPIQYTVRGISERVDEALRKHAVREGLSLNAFVVKTLALDVGMREQPLRHSDLDDLAGTWIEDPEFDRAIREMDTVDGDLWK